MLFPKERFIMVSNKLKYTELPGCFERHLQRRDGNILFPVERRSISAKEIENACQKDKIDQEIFTVNLDGLKKQLNNSKEMTIAQGGFLLEGFQNLIEEAASIGGEALGQISILEKTEDDIIQQLNLLFPNGKDLLEKGHALSLLARIPYLAQIKRKDSPVLEGEHIATLLSESLEIIALIGYSSRFWPDFKPTREEIKIHLNEAVQNGFKKTQAQKLLDAWDGNQSNFRSKNGQMNMNIIGIEGLSGQQLENEIQRGAKFAIYQYCISIGIMSFKRPSAIYFNRGGENNISKGFVFSLISLLLGWWGIPWGPIYTIGSLIINFQGGKDVTKEVLASLKTINS
jgi:hypothetical protein